MSTRLKDKIPLEDRLKMARQGTAEILAGLAFDNEDKVLFAIIENPNVTEKVILAICRRRVIPSRLLETISKNAKWTQNYQIRSELVKNPRTPTYIALRYVKSLYRLELSQIIKDVSVPPAIRVNAEHILKERLRDLTLGDKITLAHTATAPVLRLLLMEGEPKVFKTALENVRLAENDLIYILNAANTGNEILRIISEHKKWANRYEVKLAIARHPRSDPDIIRNLLKNCLQQDLQEIIDTTTLPLNVRKEAKKKLRERIADMNKTDKLILACRGKKDVLNMMVYEEDEEIFRNLLKNPHLKHEHVVTITHKTRDPQTLAAIARNEQWRANDKIALALYHNTRSPEYVRSHLKNFIDQIES